MGENQDFQFTILDLQRRIADWSAQWCIKHPTPPLLAILLYQELYMLTHTLLGSIQWVSENQGPDSEQIKLLSPALKQADDITRCLALGESVYSKQEAFSELYQLACKAFTIKELRDCLIRYPALPVTLPDLKSLPLVTESDQAITWDAFSRPRWVAAQNGKMIFYKNIYTIDLDKLPALETSIEGQMRKSSGSIIAKTIRPVLQPGSTSLVIKALFLVATPNQIILPSPWTTAADAIVG